MMDDVILISYLNDFIFCPVSIYFHNLYGNRSTITYQNASQINGKHSHTAVDTGKYSTKKEIITALSVYSEKYNLVGVIDIYNMKTKTLIERKRQIKEIYDGYIFQMYAQYFSMVEMGYTVEHLQMYSMVDNKTYRIDLPENDMSMFQKFEELVENIRAFQVETFVQDNQNKCMHCIYEPACDRSFI